jgi:TnpA family transposase
LQIEEHYTDTGGATDHVFGLCHLFGFRFAQRIRDLKDRRLYLFPGQKPQPILDPLVGGFVDVRHITAHWNDILRLATSNWGPHTKRKFKYGKERDLLVDESANLGQQG